jgi:ubiquinone/menaquinone biosynthesis C-methylase UbiE
MDEERLIHLLVELHEGLPRLGPGNAESTSRALSLCRHLPAEPEILDVGCGTGVQTLVLAANTDGRITATDLIPAFLADLDRAIVRDGLEDRIEIREADMTALPFPEKSFDLIWSEGAIYIMGFDNGISAWRPLVKPGGYLVVSEVSWFESDPPQELREFWAENYPAMRTVAGNLESARDLGWQAIANFHLPVEAWTEDYYGPLRKRIPEFREAQAGDLDAQAVADLSELEMSILNRFSDYYGYEFYIFHRPD